MVPGGIPEILSFTRLMEGCRHVKLRMGRLSAHHRPQEGARNAAHWRTPWTAASLADGPDEPCGAARGRDAEGLAQEAIERFVDYDEWLTNEVEKGLTQIAQGAELSHEEVGTRIEKLLTE
jgi:hypothetical protein